MVHVHLLLDEEDLDRGRVRVETNPHLPDASPLAMVDLPEVVLSCRPSSALSSALRRWADQIDEQAAHFQRRTPWEGPSRGHDQEIVRRSVTL